VPDPFETAGKTAIPSTLEISSVSLAAGMSLELRPSRKNPQPVGGPSSGTRRPAKPAEAAEARALRNARGR